MHSPSEDHMDAVIRILRYLKSSPGKGIMFTKGDALSVEGYIDADWAGSIDEAFNRGVLNICGRKPGYMAKRT